MISFLTRKKLYAMHDNALKIYSIYTQMSQTSLTKLPLHLHVGAN